VGAEPAGKGFVVQVMATKQRRDADALAKRLAAKGYPSFVSTAPKRVFRVRVGKYSDREQAEAVKARLEKEEQFKPWVTR
jgi:cell division septation protein DedD